MSDRFDMSALEAATRDHTGEPLVADGTRDLAYVRKGDGEQVALLYWSEDIKVSAIATGKLFAAAPALLAECRRLTNENAQLRKRLDGECETCGGTGARCPPPRKEARRDHDQHTKVKRCCDD